MAGVLPADDEDAALMNAATMELGAVVCTARTARCAMCPISHACAWRAAGYPDTGDIRRRQARYEGSDRQARGAVLAVLREATSHEIAQDDMIPDWPDARQRDRAIGSLIADGLVEAADGAIRLPGPRISPVAP
jgi:A/G-specific adenine glycosylase